MEQPGYIRFIPGFKSGTPWKMVVAGIFYFIFFLMYFAPPRGFDNTSFGISVLLTIIIIGVMRCKMQQTPLILRIFAYIGVAFVMLFICVVFCQFHEHAVMSVISDDSNMILTEEKMGEETVITDQERSAIGFFNEIFKAYNDRDERKIRELDYRFAQQGRKQQQTFLEQISKCTEHTLHYVYIESYNDHLLKGVFVYHFNVEENSISNVVTSVCNFTLAEMDGNWMLINVSQHMDDENSLKHFNTYFQMLEKAKEKYGTDDLTDWK